MMKILCDVCSLPTAPFVEQAVVHYVRQFVARRPRLKLSSDTAGNLLIELRGSRRGPRWVFGAHMDHPGFCALRMVGGNRLRAAFRGFVDIIYVRGTKVVFFDAEGEVKGTVIAATPGRRERGKVPAEVTVKVDRPVAKGSPGMFDQGKGRIQHGIFHSRACDDVAGAAAALAMLDELHRRRQAPRATVAVLLTRAEEEGFIGAIAAAMLSVGGNRGLLRKSDRIVAIECSAEQPYALQGRGVVIRIGDRTSIFNSSLTYFLTQAARELAKRDRTFKCQRALMPGGTCEATVYDIYGHIASAVCVALGNYHNMDTTRKKIAPEYIDVNDWRNMVKLFVHLARTGHKYEPGHAFLRHRVEKRFNLLKGLLGAMSR